MRLPVLLLVPFLAAWGAGAEPARPKLGPQAVPVQAATEHLRAAPAPDFWLLQPFYVAQDTSSACSVASVAMALNALRGVPDDAEATLVTQASLLAKVADESWIARTVEDGEGVTFEQLVQAVEAGAAAFELTDVRVSAFRPADSSAESLVRLRALLAANEGSDRDVALVYYNQGVVTGDWDGPHISPIGAYDAASDRVLILDVDRAWYVPYWTSAATLLEAMRRPAGAEHGVLAGETGGIVLVRRD